MNAPDFRPGYLRLPHAVWRDIFCRAPLTRRQLQIVSAIIRESWGWRAPNGGVYLWTRPLTSRRLSEATGLPTDHLRRDLRILVARGVLLESEERYQFVPEPELWKTREEGAPPRQPRAPEPPSTSADPASPPPFIKKAKKSKRNVPAPTKSALSTPVDNSRPDEAISTPRSSRKTTGAITRATAVLQGLIGPLSAADTRTLKAWIREEGVAAVWQEVAPCLARGARAARAHLARRLGERQQTPDR